MSIFIATFIHIGMHAGVQRSGLDDRTIRLHAGILYSCIFFPVSILQTNATDASSAHAHAWSTKTLLMPSHDIHVHHCVYTHGTLIKMPQQFTSDNFWNDAGVHAGRIAGLCNSSSQLAVQYSQHNFLLLRRLWQIRLEESLKVWMTDTWTQQPTVYQNRLY